MGKSKIFLRQTLETDGINVYKNGKLVYSPIVVDEKRKFSLLVLYARNFHFGNLKKILNSFSIDCIHDAVVVMSKNDLKKYHTELEAFDIKVVSCPYPNEVLYPSLKAGLRAVSQRTQHIILHFGNLSEIRGETLECICRFADSSSSEIIIPTFNNVRGHPIVFRKSIIGELMSLRKEKGLPYLIRKFLHEIAFVPVLDPGVLRKKA